MKSPIVLLSQPLMPDNDPGFMARRIVVGAIANVRRQMERKLDAQASLLCQEINCALVLQQLVEAMQLSTLEAIESLGSELSLDILHIRGIPEFATLEEDSIWWDERIAEGPWQVEIYDRDES